MVDAGEIYRQATALLHQGRLDEAEALYRQILNADPNHADAYHMLGVAACQRGEFEQGALLIGKAIDHSRQGEPANAFFHNNLGNALMALNRIDDASAAYAAALDIDPDLAESHYNTGNIFKDQHRPEDAVTCYERALAINPEYVEARSNLGIVLKSLGRFNDAVECYRRALGINPDLPLVHRNLGDVLAALGQAEAALACYEKAIALRPNFAEAHSNLGNVLRDLEQLEDAVASYRNALAIKPEFVDAHYNLGVALHDLGRLDEAVASYREAIVLKPDYVDAHNNLGASLKDLGELDEAVASYHNALAIDPDFTPALSNLLVTMPFMSNFTADDVFAEAKRAGAVFEAPFADLIARRHGNDPDPDRPLKIGYLSPYLTKHSLTPQIEPIFKAHRRDRVSIHVYAHVPRPDEITVRLKELADSWVFVHDMSDQQVAERIIQDGIDILVDPMGHWAANRLQVFARKPAPIQVSYLCQGPTTGLTAMDYAFGDRWLNEGGAMQSFATEQVVELAGGFGVTSMERETPIGPLPCEANGFITFCSFNNPGKISDISLRLWAGVLDAVPESRLMIKGKWLTNPGNSALLTGRLEGHGIPAGRVELRGFVPGPDHLAVHNETDIALDTAPFTGGATTVDALWMGVPVITLIGDTISGRYSYSHLSRVGAPELAAPTQAEYRDIAVTLAGDAARLRQYRQTFRPALLSSLCDADTHVEELEDAFRVMWRRWCDGLEPEAFTGLKP